MYTYFVRSDSLVPFDEGVVSLTIGYAYTTGDVASRRSTCLIIRPVLGKQRCKLS